MFFFMFFILVVLGLAWLFSLIADNPGLIVLEWDWLSKQLGYVNENGEVTDYLEISVIMAVIGLIVTVLAIMMILSFLRGIFGTPRFLSNFFGNRRREKGYKALSQGLIAASAGDVDTARTLTKQSRKLLKDEPLVGLLGTQTALLEGNREAATENFKTMLENDDTRMVALRGLFMEAERQGQGDAARHYAEEAARTAPSLPWAGNAKLRYSAADNDWDIAIQTLESNRAAGLIDRNAAKRQRAVLLTAKAMSVGQASPENAKKLAKEAHKLAKNLVPAATTFARAASRLGDIRGASKIIEAAWKQEPHPELAEAYATVRPGDSVQDRLSRAKKLAAMKANHPQSNFAVATASIDAKDWEEARKALEPILTTRPTERACVLMASIEEGEHGDKGRMRDWLSRAVRAPADEAWTADGYVSDEWMPVSPKTGEIDAFEWKVPVDQLGVENAPVLTLEELKAEATPIVINPPQEDKPEEMVATVADEVEDAEVVEPETDQKAETTEEPKSEIAANADTVEDETKTESTSKEAETIEEKSDAKADDTKAAIAAEDDKAEKPDTEEEAIEAKADNVVSIEDAKPKSDEAETADSDKNANADSNADSSFEETAQTKQKAPYQNEVEFPLDRRPDDPGPHPDKEPPKKRFKLF